MAKKGVSGDGAMVYPVFIDTNLDTHLALIVSDTDAVSDLKKKIIVEHPRCFPTIGKIEVHALQVKRKGHFYHLSDSILVQNAFGGAKKSWFLHVDASSSEHQSLKQHLTKPDNCNQLALPWVTDSPSNSRHDVLVDISAKRLSHCHDSSSLQPGQRVPGVDGSSQGGSCREIPKYVETEDRYINVNHRKTVYSDSNKRSAIAVQRDDVGSERIISKKRIRDVRRDSSLDGASESGPAAKKKRKTERNENSGKAFEKDNVLIPTTNDVTSKAYSSNLETYPLEQGKGRNAITDGLFAEALDDGHLSTISISENKRMKRNGKRKSAKPIDQRVTVGPNVQEADEKRTLKEKVEIFHNRPDKVSGVAVIPEKNIQHGPLSKPSGFSQKKKAREQVQEVFEGTKALCSTMRGSSKEVFPTPLIEELHNLKKNDNRSAHNNVGFDNQSFEGDQFDKFEQDKEMSLSHDPEVKLLERNRHVYQGDKDKEPLRASKLSDPKGAKESENTGVGKRKKKKKAKKSAAINDDESVLKVVKKRVNCVSISGPIPAFGGHLIDETRKDEIILSHNEGKDILEKKATDASPVGADRDADKVIGTEAEFSLPTETNISQRNPENMNGKSRKKLDNTSGSRMRKKSAKVSAAINEDESVVKQENNAPSAAEKEENILSHTDRKELSEEKSIEESQMTAGRESDILIGNDAELLLPIETNRILDEEDVKVKSKECENTNGNKRKKKVKKSAARDENALAVEHANEAVIDTTSDVPNPASDGCLIEKLEKDESVLIYTESTGIPAEKSMDASHRVPDRESDDVIVSEAETLLPGETNKYQENVNEKSRSRRKKSQISTAKSSQGFPTQEPEGVVDHLQLNQVDRNQEYAPSLDTGLDKKAKRNQKAHSDLPCKDEEVGRQEFRTINANMRDIRKLTILDTTSKTMKITGAATSKTSGLEQSAGLELEPEKGNGIEHVSSLSEKISKDVCLSEVPPSLVLENVVDVSNREGEGIDFKQYFVPDQRHTEVAPTNMVKEVRKSKRFMKAKMNTKKLDVPSVGTSPDQQKSLLSPENHGDGTSQMKNFTSTQSQRPLSKVENTEVVISSKKSPEVSVDEMKAPNSHHIDQFKTPKKVRQAEVAIVSRANRSAPATKGNKGSLVGSSSSSESSDRSRRGMVNNRRDLSLDQSNMAVGKTVARNTGEVVNNSQCTKSLLATPGAIFGDDSSNSSADDNVTVNSDASTRTPSDKSSSSELEGESDSSLDSGRNGSYASKRKGARNHLVDSQSSAIKNKTIDEILRSSSRFKKAKLTASQLNEDTESVEFVPDSQANP